MGRSMQMQLLGTQVWRKILALTAIILPFSLPLPATQVTFQVDLSNQPSPSPDGIHILGAFNAFNPAADSLTPIGPNRYAITLTLPAGSLEMYKFVNGNNWTGTEGVFGGCAFNTYRLLTVPVNDTVLPTVCFGHCDSACTPAPGWRIACVGNSITYGYGLPNPSAESYPSRLKNTLGPGYLIENFGASGTAVIRMAGNPYTQSDPFRHLLPYQPQEVILMLGINDSKSAIWGPHGGRFAADYDSLVMALDTLASNPHIWIGLPTKAFSGLAGINEMVLADSIIPLIREHARRNCRDQIDMHGFTSGLSGGFPDGIHPDTATTQLIADEFHRVLSLSRPTILQNGIQLTASGGYGWQWYLNGDTVATAAGGQGPTLAAILPGTYRVGVKVDSLFEHILISDSLEVMPVALPENPEIAILLYPNPVNHRLYWNLGREMETDVEVIVVDVRGRIVRHEMEKQGRDSMDVHELPAGFYCILFNDGNPSIRRLFWKY
jgi:lysophospholipase L1-like esterase